MNIISVILKSFPEIKPPTFAPLKLKVDEKIISISSSTVFPNVGGILHSGASGRIILDRKHEDVIIIPCSATFELQDLVFAYKYIDGKAVSSRLSVALTDDGRNYIVNSGLEEGDIIISEGVGLIRDGQDITLK